MVRVSETIHPTSVHPRNGLRTPIAHWFDLPPEAAIALQLIGRGRALADGIRKWRSRTLMDPCSAITCRRKGRTPGGGDPVVLEHRHATPSPTGQRLRRVDRPRNRAQSLVVDAADELVEQVALPLLGCGRGERAAVRRGGPCRVGQLGQRAGRSQRRRGGRSCASTVNRRRTDEHGDQSPCRVISGA